MPNVNDLVISKYLKKSDLGPKLKALYTVVGGQLLNVAPENAAPDRKWVVSFKETEKLLPLNKTNLFAFAAAMRNEDTDSWIGKKIVVEYDPNVAFKGKIVGGLRLRAPSTGAPVAAPPPPEEDDLDGEIPF